MDGTTILKKRKLSFTTYSPFSVFLIGQNVASFYRALIFLLNELITKYLILTHYIKQTLIKSSPNIVNRIIVARKNVNV